MGELIQYYKQGMKYFVEGSLDKAFSYLTLVASAGIEEEKLNNAIALMLIYKGNFEEAYKIFALNNKNYRDGISERYLSSIEQINNCIEKHNLAVSLIKQYKYEEALFHLLSLRTLGFRTLNDDILTCSIYAIKRDYVKCKEILEEMHLINKEEVFYYEMKDYIDKKKYSKFKLYAASVAAVAIIFSSIAISGFNKKSNNTEKEAISKPTVSVKKTNAETDYKILANLSNDMMKENLYDFWAKDKELDSSKLDENSRSLYNQLKNTFKDKAESYFYNNGLELYRSENYKKAFEYMSIAYENKKGSYLDEHIIFYLAKSAKASGKGGSEYYREYINKYPKGCYIQESLYDLAIIDYKSNNIKEAKKYASIIVEQYSDTMYNNDKIRSIIE
ncbi:hypothetical protein P8V03_06660 [Clostridium sp. A1-XYC3]|uniref:Tetratricopeptide repeat protein n=1 Tax=Clostridium tanneri TaxID=3037988 RepID=A0ABU4JRQ1_9CLOT|nr:hypothetical protein [Clostridium sp. A1-XYC3]MDW8800833.1 hypothetical protein [Clostridium sp. A1-XYC3]